MSALNRATLTTEALDCAKRARKAGRTYEATTIERLLSAIEELQRPLQAAETPDQGEDDTLDPDDPMNQPAYDGAEYTLSEAIDMAERQRDAAEDR